MIKVSILSTVSAVLAGVFGCGTAEPGGIVPCVSDPDCKTGELCLQGFCVFQAMATTGADAGGRDGGGSMDAETGAPDAHLADVGLPDAGQPRCMVPDCNRCDDLYPTALICENFDDVVETPWIPSVGAGATLALESSEFRSGGGSLRLNSPAGTSTRYRRTLDSAITEGGIHVRVYVYVPDTFQAADFVALVNLANDDGEKVSLDLEEMQRVQVFRTGGLQVSSGDGTVPNNRWTCLEYHYRVEDAGVTGLVSLSVDGQIVSQQSPAPSVAPPGGFTRVEAGIVSSGTENPTV